MDSQPHKNTEPTVDASVDVNNRVGPQRLPYPQNPAYGQQYGSNAYPFPDAHGHYGYYPPYDAPPHPQFTLYPPPPAPQPRAVHPPRPRADMYEPPALPQRRSSPRDPLNTLSSNLSVNGPSNTEITALRAEIESLKVEVQSNTSLYKELSTHVQTLEKAITNGDKENDHLHLRPFDPTKIRKNLTIDLRLYDVGIKRVDVSKALDRAIKVGPTSEKGTDLVAFYTRRTYAEIFGRELFKHYSTTRKTSTHITPKAYIAVPKTLPEALVVLFCDAYGYVGDLSITYFAVAIRKAVDDVANSIFNNARRNLTANAQPAGQNPTRAARKRKAAAPPEPDDIPSTSRDRPTPSDPVENLSTSESSDSDPEPSAEEESNADSSDSSG